MWSIFETLCIELFYILVCVNALFLGKYVGTTLQTEVEATNYKLLPGINI